MSKEEEEKVNCQSCGVDWPAHFYKEHEGEKGYIPQNCFRCNDQMKYRINEVISKKYKVVLQNEGWSVNSVELTDLIIEELGKRFWPKSSGGRDGLH